MSLARALILVVGLLLCSAGLSAQEIQPTDGRIVVLDVQGNLQFHREGWQAAQPVLPGTILNTTDIVHSQNAGLLIICPDLSVRDLLPGQLYQNDVLSCSTAESRIFGESGSLKLSVSRGGIQREDIPYVLYPRNTVVLDDTITLRWNAIADVASYEIRVTGGLSGWKSDPPLLPADVEHNGVASYRLPITLQENITYTAEICVIYGSDLSRRCTDDDEWDAGNLPFVYSNDPQLRHDLDTIATSSSLGSDSAKRYAQAVLLATPFYTARRTNLTLGAYQEALNLLERIQSDDPDGALATSAELHNLRGDLYTRIQLPQAAAEAYNTALRFAPEDTVAAAHAQLGLATTTRAVSEIDAALVRMAAIVSPTEIDGLLEDICHGLGSSCLDLKLCDSSRAALCRDWANTD